MQIIMDMNGGPARLDEADDFTAFAAVAAGAPDAARLAVAAEPVGRPVDATHVYVDVDALRALDGARPEDPEWTAALDGMLAYAGSKGWTDEHGAVRAHVEWRD